MKEMGATVNARMGLNTWAAFYGTDADDVVAIHHHMIATDPDIYFLHYWGKGSAQKLATGVKAAADLLGKQPRR